METIISIVIFSIATLVLFKFMNEFMRVYNKQDTKASANIKFTKIYKSIDGDYSLASTDYFDFYDENDVDPNCKKYRWFLYASAQNQSYVHTNTAGSIQWDKITLFYLIKPEDDCKGYECCPHKSLIKNEFLLLNLSQQKLDAAINTIISKLKDFMILPGFGSYPNLAHTELISSTKVCDDITDLTIRYHRGYCQFELSVLREPEAKKHIAIGTVDLSTDPVATQFIEKIGWVTVNKNI